MIHHEIEKLIEKNRPFYRPFPSPDTGRHRTARHPCHVLLPYKIQRGLERRLVNEGAEQARVEDADFNHFIGHFAVRNIQVTVGSSRTLLVSQANMDFALPPLLRKLLVIDEIHLRDSMLIVERTTDSH